MLNFLNYLKISILVFTYSASFVAAASEQAVLSKKTDLYALDANGKYLVVISPLPAGTQIEIDRTQKVTNRPYKTSASKVINADQEWYSAVKLIKFPSTQKNSKYIKYWNSNYVKKLYSY